MKCSRATLAPSTIPLSLRSAPTMLAAAFADYNAEFRAITRARPQRFEARDWRGSQRDAVERIELYDRFVNATIAQMRERLGDGVARARDCGAHQAPLRRLDRAAARHGVRQDLLQLGHAPHVRHGRRRPRLEFIALDLDPLGSITSHVETNVYVNRGSLELLFEEMLADFRFRTPYRDFDRSVAHRRNEVAAHCEQTPASAAAGRADRDHPHVVLPDDARLPRGAHRRAGWTLPFVMALQEHRERRAGRRGDDATKPRQHPVQLHALVFPRRPGARRRSGGVSQDDPAAQAGQRAVHRARPRQAGQDRALSRAVPPPAAVGRRIRARARRSGAGDDLLHAALLRRRVQGHPRPLSLSRRTSCDEEVMQKYEMVFKHDRAGRLVDAQEFKRLQFPKQRFSRRCSKSCTARQPAPCMSTATTWSSITCTSSGA